MRLRLRLRLRPRLRLRLRAGARIGAKVSSARGDLDAVHDDLQLDHSAGRARLLRDG